MPNDRYPAAGRAARALGAAVGIAALLAAGWLLSGADRAAAPPARAPAFAAPRSDALSPLAAQPGARVAVPAPAKVDVRRASPPARAAGPPVSGVDICGFGPVQLADDDPYPLQRLPAALRLAALDSAETQLQADADPRVRAAGLLIGARGRPQRSRAQIEGLARLAAGSQDPLVYALALQACQGLAQVDAGACQLLSRAQAAQLDPDNAMPWLALAAEAAARGEADAEHEAMRRAAQAQRIGAPLDALPALVGRALAPPQPALARTVGLAAAFALHDGWRLLPAGSAQARAYCLNDAAEDDAVRAPSCRALALLLLARGPALADLGAGLALGRQWALPPAVLAAPQQEHDALLEAGVSPPDPTEPGCAAQAAQSAWAERIAQAGERQAMRDEMRRAGRSVEEWSERHRRTIALASAAVEAAAETEALR